MKKGDIFELLLRANIIFEGKNLEFGIRFEGRRCNECGEFELLDVRVNGRRIRREIVRKKQREEREREEGFRKKRGRDRREGREGLGALKREERGIETKEKTNQKEGG